MAYVGEAPWHGLGVRLEEPATSAAAMEAAGLDYEIELERLVTPSGVAVPHRFAVVRQDTRQALGTVGRGYRPIQNAEAFDFLDELVGEGAVRFDTAGALGQGERVWMLAQVPGELRVRGTDDVSHKFLLLSNSHDGSSSLRMFFTPVRVVCQNTLTFAHRLGLESGVTISHRGDIRTRLDEARMLLGIAQSRFMQLGSQMDRLAARPLRVGETEEYFRALYPDRHSDERGRAKAIRQRLQLLFEEGRGQDLPGVRHTAWAAVNAVTEYVDHYRPTRAAEASTRRDRRLASAWFGSGAQLKLLAWETALDLAV
jgi:phage/plasmid-like protein (TIGR03299 family)